MPGAKLWALLTTARTWKVRFTRYGFADSHLPCGRSRGLCRRLGPDRSRRSLPHCSRRAGCFWPPGLCGYTAEQREKFGFTWKQKLLNSCPLHIAHESRRWFSQSTEVSLCQFCSQSQHLKAELLVHLAGGEELHAFGHLEAVADKVLHCQVVII